jgi:hypothetical protein
MKRIAITLLCLALASCSGSKTTVPDPIDALVQRLNATGGMGLNGEYPDISLPSDAKPNEVLTQAVKVFGFDQGHIQTYQIQNIRQVRLDTEIYSAALVHSDLGKKIFLFKPERSNMWWTRFYDIEEEKQNN